MFGLDFAEIILIAVVAVIFLGPDKLPNAMVKVARLIKMVKNGIASAKESLEAELKLSQIKEDIIGEKQQFLSNFDDLKGFKNIDSMVKDELNSAVDVSKATTETTLSTPTETIREVVSFKKASSDV
ncbi:MAG: Sec-independent protein translocase subunit TatB [Epsilonproteobacteria bacterium]|nr:Sec-independent protein translocase subunit TatB [Campylobacterota bacterium]MBD3838887.1 Sec-independent protein translocase subunit TatB [Campylobacterota bacterium]